MANVGNATLLITPKFDNLSQSIKQAMGSAGTSSGQQLGSSIASGLGTSAVSGAVMGAVSTLTQKALSSVSASLGSAVSRVDILNNYPQVMQSLGVEAAEASASIQTMSDKLQNVPTRLDDMASVVQGMYAAASQYGVSLSTATDAGLALNDMLLAGGGSTQIVNAAMEQFRQILSKGKPDMQDWRSLLSAAPGQMNQLAESMLGAGATARDLYYALGGGKEDDAHMQGIEFASISMDKLLESIIALDNQGSDGIASFSQQAEEAQGGIGTAMANMGNAVTRGVADVIEAFGRSNVVSAINGFKGLIRNVFSVVSKIAKDIAPVVKTIGDVFVDLAPTIAGAIAAIEGMALGNKFANFITPILGKLDPLSISLGVAAGAVGILFDKMLDGIKQTDDFKNAMVNFEEVSNKASGLSNIKGSFEDISEAAGNASMDFGDFVEKMSGYAQSIDGILGGAKEEIGSLKSAQDIINSFAGQTDLSVEKQGQLQWAINKVNEEFGTTFEMKDAIRGTYTDINGEVKNLKDSINELIDAKKLEIQQAALSDALEEGYTARREAAEQLARGEREIEEERKKYYESRIQLYESEGFSRATAEESALRDVEKWNEEVAETNHHLKEAQEAYELTGQAVTGLEKELGLLASAAEEGGGKLARWAANTSDLFRATLSESGTSIGMLLEDLNTLGITSEQMTKIQEDDLLSLAGTYDGTFTSILEWIKQYNAQHIGDKDSKIEVNDLELKDAHDRVVVWNGTEFVYKDTGATVYYATLTDAQDQVYLWNGTTLEHLYGEVSVEYSSVLGAEAAIRQLASMNGFQVRGSAVVDVGSRTSGSGGHYTVNASGGHIPRHAGGFIATGPTLTKYGWIGEDGAEAYDEANKTLVPLTNRKYSQPFIDMLASGVVSKLSNKSAAYSNSSGVDIHDCTFVVRKEDDIRSVAQQLQTLINRERAGAL